MIVMTNTVWNNLIGGLRYLGLRFRSLAGLLFQINIDINNQASVFHPVSDNYYMILSIHPQFIAQKQHIKNNIIKRI